MPSWLYLLLHYTLSEKKINSCHWGSTLQKLKKRTYLLVHISTLQVHISSLWKDTTPVTVLYLLSECVGQTLSGEWQNTVTASLELWKQLPSYKCNWFDINFHTLSIAQTNQSFKKQITHFQVILTDSVVKTQENQTPFYWIITIVYSEYN